MLNWHHFSLNESKTGSKIIIVARNAIPLMNLAREQKSLATPELEPQTTLSQKP